MRLLLVEDEPDLSQALTRALVRRGMIVDQTGDLDSARAALRLAQYTAVLLDRRLPDGDGTALLPDLRALRPAPAVLLVTARDQPVERVEGLDAGADDYIVKPFDIEELLARLRAVLRRPALAASRRLSLGGVELDLEDRSIRFGGQDLRLPRRERAILILLMERAGRVVSREALEQAAYGFDDEIQPTALEPHVSRLRRRLAEAGAGLSITALRGLGYLLQVQSASAGPPAPGMTAEPIHDPGL